MLEIINSLDPFFEDCYRRIGVREYSRIVSISPPTASKTLNSYYKEGLLKMEKDRNYLFFHANKENKAFIDLSRIYWAFQLKDLIDFLCKNLISPTVVMFGSLSKGEVKQDSDIDLAVFAHKRELNFQKFEKKLNRKIQVFWFKSIQDIKDKELSNNIINGYSLN